mmetsp:Transcript_24868/g.36470  ORF Transcript_24868/g.36470 Transcript_24868/m.36470 type:complete len:702 (+) Transcript_24868:32-2137(+)
MEDRRKRRQRRQQKKLRHQLGYTADVEECEEEYGILLATSGRRTATIVPPSSMLPSTPVPASPSSSSPYLHGEQNENHQVEEQTMNVKFPLSPCPSSFSSDVSLSSNNPSSPSSSPSSKRQQRKQTIQFYANVRPKNETKSAKQLKRVLKRTKFVNKHCSDKENKRRIRRLLRRATNVHPAIDLSLVDLVTSSEYDNPLTTGFGVGKPTAIPTSSSSTKSQPLSPRPTKPIKLSPFASFTNKVQMPQYSLSSSSSSPLPMCATADMNQLLLQGGKEQQDISLSMSSSSVTLEEALLFSPSPRFVIKAEAPHIVVHANAAYGNLLASSSLFGSSSKIKDHSNDHCDSSLPSPSHTPAEVPFRTIVGKPLTTSIKTSSIESSPTSLNSSTNTTKPTCSLYSSQNNPNKRKRSPMKVTIDEPTLCSEPSSSSLLLRTADKNGRSNCQNDGKDSILDTVHRHLKLFVFPEKIADDGIESQKEEKEERQDTTQKRMTKKRKICAGHTDTAIATNPGSISSDHDNTRFHVRNGDVKGLSEGLNKHHSPLWDPSFATSSMSSHQQVVLYPIHSDRQRTQELGDGGRSMKNRGPDINKSIQDSWNTWFDQYCYNPINVGGSTASSAIAPLASSATAMNGASAIKDISSHSIYSLSTSNLPHSPPPIVTHYLVEMESSMVGPNVGPSPLPDKKSDYFVVNGRKGGMHAIG